MTQRRKQVQVEDWKPESGALFKAYVRCMAFRFTTQCTENRAFCTVSTIVSGHQPHTLDLPPAALLWWDPALITDAQVEMKEAAKSLWGDDLKVRDQTNFHHLSMIHELYVWSALQRFLFVCLTTKTKNPIYDFVFPWMRSVQCYWSFHLVQGLSSLNSQLFSWKSMSIKMNKSLQVPFVVLNRFLIICAIRWNVCHTLQQSVKCGESWAGWVESFQSIHHSILLLSWDISLLLVSRYRHRQINNQWLLPQGVLQWPPYPKAYVCSFLTCQHELRHMNSHILLFQQASLSLWQKISRCIESKSCQGQLSNLHIPASPTPFYSTS